ncbi:hypothetical protein Nmel_006337, partial [Mimus melanotis]
AAGDDVVVVGTPVDVQDGARVAAHRGGEHEEGAAAAGLHDDGDEGGVDGAEGAVPGDTGHADVIVALVRLHRLPEHVPEFALPHHLPERHGWGAPRPAVRHAGIPQNGRQGHQGSGLGMGPLNRVSSPIKCQELGYTPLSLPAP